jgi:hypothetical protein
MPKLLFDQIAFLVALLALLCVSIYERKSFAHWFRNLVALVFPVKARPAIGTGKDRKNRLHSILFPMCLGGLFTLLSWCIAVFWIPGSMPLFLMPLSGLGLGFLLATVQDISPKFSLIKMIIRTIAGMVIVSAFFLLYLSIEILFEYPWFILFYFLILYGMASAFIIAHIIPDLSKPGIETVQ